MTSLPAAPAEAPGARRRNIGVLPTLTGHPITEATPADHAVELPARIEFGAWLDHHATATDTDSPVRTPPIDTPEGLPPGWSLLGQIGQDFYLVRCTSGVGLIREQVFNPNPHGCRDGDSSKLLVAVKETLLRLTTLLLAPNHLTGHLRPGLCTLLLAAYDPTDPIEAAEQTLVALGGIPRRTPAALST